MCTGVRGLAQVVVTVVLSLVKKATVPPVPAIPQIACILILYKIVIWHGHTSHTEQSGQNGHTGHTTQNGQNVILHKINRRQRQTTKNG